MVNRMEIVIFISDRHEETGQIQRRQENTKKQVRVSNHHRVHLSIMDARNNQRQKCRDGQYNHGTHCTIDHGHEDGLNQKEFSAEFIVVG